MIWLYYIIPKIIYLLSQPTFFSYLGAGYQLPKVQAESLVLIDSKVKLDPFTFRVHVDEPSLTFKVKLINSNVTWKLIFFLSCKLYCKLFFLLFHVCTRRLFCYTIAVSLKVIQIQTDFQPKINKIIRKYCTLSISIVLIYQEVEQFEI